MDSTLLFRERFWPWLDRIVLGLLARLPLRFRPVLDWSNESVAYEHDMRLRRNVGHLVLSLRGIHDIHKDFRKRPAWMHLKDTLIAAGHPTILDRYYFAHHCDGNQIEELTKNYPIVTWGDTFASRYHQFRRLKMYGNWPWVKKWQRRKTRAQA